MTSFSPRRLLALLGLIASSALFAADPTETVRQYLSGHGPSDAVPWEFTVSGGRRAGEKATILVPSQWEQQGFGSYNYGQVDQKSSESGYYRTTFQVPADWQGRRVRLGFDGVMTDTTVRLNGKSVGPTHQGGFNQFRYDVTALVKFDGENLLEVDVSKTSADPETERAERGGDYWVFGGIYRPVWLEATPAVSIEHVAVDARADGSFTADVTLSSLRTRKRPDGPALVPERLEGQIFDADGKPFGDAFAVKIPGGGAGRLRLATKAAQPRLWSAETPALYTLQVTRWRGDTALHTVKTRFGFRTFEIREGEGFYVNGQRVLLKGVNRHSFRPKTGRALDREDCYEDVRVIRSMNMNAVRMSHYAPDPAFLEACDELGLYVLNELSGWQAAHGTPIGRLLVRELVERDVNHPSVIAWSNGNEGGWNRDLDGDYALYDPQQRPVLHPWDPFGGVDTFHYPNYSAHLRRLTAPANIVMPTEFLHALYDGGAGAGLDDYWKAILASPVGGGGFIWDYADEGIARTDQGGKIDVFSTFAPDGILGPNLEKEASYYTVREVWSPVQIDTPVLDEKFDGALTVHNRHDFTSLAACRVEWALQRFDDKATTLARGEAAGPEVAPHGQGTLKLALPASWREADALAVTIKNPRGEALWTWTWATPRLDARFAEAARISSGKPSAKVEQGADRITLGSGDTSAAFDKQSGRLLSLRMAGHEYALSNGPRLAFARPVSAAKVEWLPLRESAPTAEGVFTLATPQTASSLELEIERVRGMSYASACIELSADGQAWHTIYDASRREMDGVRYEFPPRRIAAVRVSKLINSDGTPARITALRIGHAAGRFPAEDSASAVVSSGTDKNGAWLASRGEGLSFRWSLSHVGMLRLDYEYALDGDFLYHGVTFDQPEESMKALRWLGEGPYRVWQNRLQGTWLGLHETKRHVLQPGSSFEYPEFEGYFAGVRWARLDTSAGALEITVQNPLSYLRIGTPRVNHPKTTAAFPAGDLSFLHAIPGMGSKFIDAADSGPSGMPAKAQGPYQGSLIFSAAQ